MTGITLKQVHGIEGRIGSALLGSDLTKKEVEQVPGKKLGAYAAEAANLYIARVRGIELGAHQASGLIVNPDGSISIRKIVRGMTDEELVAKYIVADWGYIHPSIHSDRCVSKLKLEIGAEKSITIKKVVPVGGTWKLEKVVSSIGSSVLELDFEDLTDLVLGHRDELLKLGVRWVVALGVRFRDAFGGERVVYADLEDRRLCLRIVEDDWYDSDWFGS